MRVTVRAIAAVVLVLAAFIPAAAANARGAPPAFFGISPQTELTGLDAAYMRAGGIGTVRWPIGWESVQPAEGAPFQWRGFDRVVRVAARHRLRVLPFLSGTPAWAASAFTTLPVDTREQRRGWIGFVRAAVRRYGPGGGFWRAHPSLSPLPVRAWQIWNEVNFFYFAFPVSPRRYGRLVRITGTAIHRTDPKARVILSGLFGMPRERGRRGMPAVRFLAALYRVRGIRPAFDGIALHPYAAHVPKLKRLVRGMRSIARRNSDRVPLFITEMGWGSQDDPQVVSFEQGLYGQRRELRRAYRWLIRERRDLNIRSVYWFSWKDMAGACSFCDSAGLFYAGSGFVAKPAWKTFVAFSGGRIAPGKK